MWRGQSNSLEQTLAIGRAIAQHAQAGDVVALVGELGAGKTQLVRGMAKGLGADEAQVASPTFVVVHEYDTPAGQPALVHIDAYRLRSVEDLESVGWDAVTSGSEMRRDAVVAIEWADRLGELAGQDVLTVTIEHAGDGRRELTVSTSGAWEARVQGVRAALDAAVGADAPGEPGGTGHFGAGASQRRLGEDAGDAPGAAPCPICGEAVPVGGERFPFCSDRCRTIDLGRWIDGKYLISRPIEESDLDEE